MDSFINQIEDHEEFDESADAQNGESPLKNNSSSSESTEGSFENTRERII